MRKELKTLDNKQIIMHKDIEVCSITLDTRGYVASVDSVENEELLPCVISNNKEELKFGIQKWLLTRMVGRSRSDYSPLRTFYGDEYFIIHKNGKEIGGFNPSGFNLLYNLKRLCNLLEGELL
jgi:hypothetical protein